MLLLLLVAIAGADTLPTYVGTAGQIRVPLARLEAEAAIDGVLDDAVWQQAARLTGFSQYSPADGRPAEQDTEVLVWYSPTALFFGVRAQARPGTVRATLANRDRLAEEDRVEFYLGTYNDGHQALVFGVNPLGVQQDGTLAEQGRTNTSREATDLSPDFVYTSQGRLTDYGFEVEIRIPFKTLRYQSVDPQDWGLHVIRRIQATGHEDSWVPARRAAASFLAQSGTLQGLRDLRRGLVMDLNPVVTARATGGPASESPSNWRYDSSAEFGGNLRWGVTPNLTLNGTVNPDFSQVEADASQILTDPRQVLFFPEKRPFFLEGLEQFATPNQLIYSKRIFEPVAAAKFTGKVSGTTVATMLALDGKALSRTRQDNPFFAIARVQRDLKGGSRAGLVFTNRSEPGQSSQVAGVDTRFVTKGGLALSAQLVGSLTSVAGDSKAAPLWDLDVRRSGRHFGFNVGFRGVSDEFVAAAGIIRQPDAVTVSGGTSWTVYGGQGSFIARATGGVQSFGRWSYDEFTSGQAPRDRSLYLSGNFQLRGGWSLELFTWVERFGYDARLYRSYALERRLPAGTIDTVAPYPGGGAVHNLDPGFILSTPWVGPFAAAMDVTYGNDVDYEEWSSANILFVNSSLQFRPTTQLRADATYILTWYRRRSDGSMLSVSHIPRVKVEYQVTRSVFLRMVGEYRSSHRDALRDDGRTHDPILILDPANGLYKRDPALRQQSDGFRGDFLFSFQPSPGTVFFAGYGGGFQDAGRFRFADLTRTTDGFFVKASYLFRM